MGGCCCSSRKYQLHGTPVYYYCPQALEERDSLTSHDSTFSTELLIDMNLDGSDPDTYRSPPPPIPFDMVLGIPKSTTVESVGGDLSGVAHEKPTCINVKESDGKVAHETTLLDSPKKVEVGFRASKGLDAGSIIEEEDVCPTCFEEYDAENPRISTKCNHRFHLSCILEWMERSDTCPICNQEMDFETL